MIKFTKSIIKKFTVLAGLAIIVSVLILPLTSQISLAQEKAPRIDSKSRCDKYKEQFAVGTTNIIGETQVFCSGTEAALWAIKILLAFSGTTAILFLIFGGYLYLTSGGSDEQAEKGKKVLVNSIIGLVVIVMSTAIVTIISSTLALK